LNDRAPRAPPEDDPGEADPKREALTIQAKQRLAELYQLHRSEIVRFVRRTFGDGPPDPEDAAQAAFEHYAGLLQPDAVDNARAFLYRSARNFVLDFKRRAKVRARFAGSADSAEYGNSRDELDAERVLSAKERLAILEAAIKGMQPHLREVFVLNRIHELSHAEIARRKRISQTQSKKLVALGLKICERALRQAERRWP
jgi:RNA polymerase sigma factor (sigma-70 family)